jgi:outer membrane protein TolC
MKLLLTVAGLVVATPASALQPLDEFLRGARTSSVDNAQARAARRQLEASADGALGRSLPRLSIRGEYIRNQYESTLQLPGPAGGAPAPVTIVPYNQFGASATLDVPLVDLASFARVSAARSEARASEIEEAATELRVQSSVAQGYYQLVANLALVESSRRAVAVVEVALRIADERRNAGTAPLLDVDRARAEVERNIQQLAVAELQVSLVAQALQTLSGITPALGGVVALADDLHEEPSLEQLEISDDGIPAIAAAAASRVAAERQATAQGLTLVPSLAASVTERVTNFGGLGGRDTYWQAVLGLGWSFDLTTLANVRAQAASAEVARVRERRARLAAQDDLHRNWMTVRTNIARSRSARVEATVSARAAGLALDRYEIGEGTQLELLQAQRDAFSADAARIQADADLLNSRAQLRIASGESLLEVAAGETR